MGVCAAKLDTTTTEGKLHYIFEHFDYDRDSFFCAVEFVEFASKIGGNLFDPNDWDSAVAEYGQGWVCDGQGGIPFDGILMMYNQYTADTVIPGSGKTRQDAYEEAVKRDFDYVLRLKGPPK